MGQHTKKGGGGEEKYRGKKDYERKWKCLVFFFCSRRLFKFQENSLGLNGISQRAREVLSIEGFA